MNNKWQKRREIPAALQSGPVPASGRRRRRRSSGAKAASAVLYVLIVIGVSAVLATVGWTWANDLLALNKEYSSTVIELPESIFQYQEVTDENGDTTTVSTADMDYVADELKEAGLIEYKFLFKIFCWVSNADEKVTAAAMSWIPTWTTGGWWPT